MRRLIGCFLLCSCVFFLAAPSVHADEIKRALFVLGIHMGGAEGVAVEFVGDAPKDRPGGIALIKRTVTDSINVADVLKLPTTGLKSLLADVDKVSFAEMAKRLGDLRLEMQAAAAKSINPGAGAFFIMGIHQSGAERVALGAAPFQRKDKPGTEALIERQLTWMADGTGTIMVSAKTVLDIQSNMSKGATFADLASQLEKLRLSWQEEIAKQPGFGVIVGGGVGVGKVIFSQAGNLANTDPKDKLRKDMFSKVHTVALKGGQAYVIDLTSGDGSATKGLFDPWLRVEDSTGKSLREDDDGGDGFNSRMEFVPTQDGNYNFVVTSYAPGATGPYELTVRLKQ